MMSSALLTEYQKNSEQLLEIARSFSKNDSLATPIAGEWPAAYVIHHMADAELHFATRYLSVIAEDRPAIAAFNEELYPLRLNYAQRSIATSTATIAAVYQSVFEILSQLSLADWNRVGIHSEKGDVTLTQLVELAVGHNLGHANQLRELKAALNK